MNIRAFGKPLGLLLALALLIPVQVFAQDEPLAITDIDVIPTEIVVGVDTTFDVDVTWLTATAWTYTEVYVNGNAYGCFDTADVAGGTGGTVTFSVPVQAPLTTLGEYTIFMFQANNATCNDALNTAAVLACVTTGACASDGLDVINESTVTVTKTFSDSNPAVVPIALVCDDANAVVTADDGDADITDTAEFTVSGYVDGTTCTASEDGVPAGYTSDNTACVDLALTSGVDSPCTIDNQQDPVTVTITKQYQGTAHPNGNPQVEITLTCPTGTVTTSPATTVGLTVDFEVSDFPYDGEDCVATETVPAGWVQASATGCDALTVIPGGTAPSCTIANRPTFANFTVNKNFSDSNPNLAAVVTPVCVDDGTGPGLVLGTASGNAFHGTNFNTTVEFFTGVTNCTATEVDLVGYTQDLAVSTCDTNTLISDVADGTCIIHNQQDPITILASKEYVEGTGPAATFAASCNQGTVTAVTTSASVGVPAEFTVSNFPYNGTSCAVTEPVAPDGYEQVSSTCDSLNIVPSDADTLCTITNDVLGNATFEVTKEFTDGNNPTEVEVTINCFTGLPITQSQIISETQEVTFVVTSFDTGELDCEITEEELFGYTPTYQPGGPSSNDSVDGCNFYDVEGGDENTCHIVNDADPVDVEIEKLWVIDGPSAHQVDTSYKLTLYCDAEIADASYCHDVKAPAVDSPEGNGGWTCKKNFYGDDSDVFTGHVTPEYPSSHCWVDESVYDDSVEIDNDCGNLVISAGTGASCLITNTVFFEGIPTLSQYGMAIMALLMLGVGLVGFRRFA